MTNARVELVLAAGFLTRLRLPPVAHSDAAMARAVRWYPTVGLAIGVALAALFWGLSLIIPQALATLLTIAAGMLLTGALHEDGLADVADGLGGSGDRDRALEIMHDSRIGSYGVLALGLTLAIKITALTMLPLTSALVAIIAGHGLGRFAMAWLMAHLPYARSAGAAGFMAGAPKGTDAALWVSAAIAIALILTIGITPAIAVVLALMALLALVARRLKARLGGYTGDALGAVEQLTEALIPLVLLACL